MTERLHVHRLVVRLVVRRVGHHYVAALAFAFAAPEHDVAIVQTVVGRDRVAGACQS